MGIIWQWCLDHLAGPGGLVMLGAILSAAGGLWLLVQQNKFERDMRRNAEENLLRTKENLEQTQEAIRQITGGDSYCYYSPIRGPATSKQRLVLFVVGQYHLFDVIAAIVDLEKQKSLRSKGGIPLEDIFADRRTIRLGTINRYQGWLQPEWDLGPGDSHRYQIHFTARNGAFTQFLTLRAVKGEWSFASRVERNGKIIEGSQHISEDFPPNEQGQVHW